MADLSSLGLSQVEEKVYKTLLVSGQLNRGEIAVTSKVGMNDVQSALDSLVNKKLVRAIPGLQGRYAYLLPLGNVKTELESSVKQIDSLGKELNQASADTISQIKKNLDEANESIRNNVDSKSTDIRNKVQALKESLKLELQEQRTSLETTSSNLESSLASSNSAFQGFTNEKVGNYAGTSNSKFDAHSKLLSTSLEKLKMESESLVQQAKSVIPKDKLANFTDQKQSANVGLDNVGQQYDLAVNDIEISLIQSVSKIDESGKKSLNEIDTFAYQYDESNKAATSQLIADLTAQTDANKLKVSDAGSSATESKDSVALHLETFGSNFAAKTEKGTQDMENLEKQVINFIDDNQIKLSDAGKNIHAEVGHLIQTVDASYSGVVKDLKNDLEGQITADLTGLESTFDLHFKKMMEEVKLKLNEFKLKLNQNVEAKVSELHSKKTTMKEELEGNIRSSSDSFQSELQTSSTSQRASGEEILGHIRTNFSEFNNSASEMVKQITSELNSLSSSIAGYLENVNSALEEANSSNSDKLTAQQEKISANYNQLVSNHFNTQKTSLQQDITSLNELVSTQIASSKKAMNDLVTDMKAQMDTKISSLESSFANVQDLIAQNAESAINEIHSKYLASFSNGYDHAGSLNNENQKVLNELVASLKAIVGETSNVLVQSFNEQLTGLKSSFSSVVDGFENQSTTNLDLAEKSSNEIMAQVTQVSQQGGTTTVNAVSQTVDIYKAKFEESSSLIVEKTLALTQVIDNLFQYQEAAVTPTLNTTHIIGKEAILLQMKDLIERVKSKVTILVPDKKMVDIDQIMGMKSTIQVTVISHIDEVSDKDWIDILHGATANVTLRSIQKSVGGGELPDFIGCEREGEEILLGTVDDAQNDYVAISSNSEYFVQILGNIVIADYARGKSKQIRKG